MVSQGGGNMTEYIRQKRIRKALSLRGMKQSELCERTGIAKTTVSSWTNQRWQPKQDALYKMAKVLDVSEMWLAGYDVPMERSVAQIKNDELVQLITEIRKNNDLQRLFSSICNLTGDQRKTIETMVNELNKLNTLH